MSNNIFQKINNDILDMQNKKYYNNNTNINIIFIIISTLLIIFFKEHKNLLAITYLNNKLIQKIYIIIF